MHHDHEQAGSSSSNSAFFGLEHDENEIHRNLTRLELLMPLRGFRQFVAFTYLGCNLLGLLANSWVFIVVCPLLCFAQVRVPKCILFHILALCVSDLATMFGMVLLNLEILHGTWRFGLLACRAYLLFDSLNKFTAPVIVLLISRTCYSIICLDKGRQGRHSTGLRIACLQLLVALAVVFCLLWPLLVYSEVSEIVVRIDRNRQQELFVRKCAFLPPPMVELLFNIIVSITSYCIPFCGFLFWYASVPFFLWRRKELLSQNSSVSSQQQTLSNGIHHPASPSVAVIRRVVITVVVLALIYLVCWTPYWIGMYAQRLFHVQMTKHTVIAMYFVHLMPYISCAAYPAIFTLFNRPIRTAHSQWRRSMQRKLYGSEFGQMLMSTMARRTSASNQQQQQLSECAARGRTASFGGQSQRDYRKRSSQGTRISWEDGEQQQQQWAIVDKGEGRDGSGGGGGSTNELMVNNKAANERRKTTTTTDDGNGDWHTRRKEKATRLLGGEEKNTNCKQQPSSSSAL